MSRRIDPPQFLAWFFALALVIGAVVPLVCGCAALEKAAPTIAPMLLQGTEQVLERELDTAADDARRHDIEQALALLRATRAAQAAAEDAARRAIEAAAEARIAAVQAAEDRRLEEQARRDAALRQLAPLLLRLGVAGKTAPAASASAPAADAGVP